MSLTPVALLNTVEGEALPEKKNLSVWIFFKSVKGSCTNLNNFRNFFCLAILFFRERGRLLASKLIDELFCMASLSKSLMCFVM